MLVCYIWFVNLITVPGSVRDPHILIYGVLIGSVQLFILIKMSFPPLNSEIKDICKSSNGVGFWPQEFVLFGRGSRFESLSQSLLGEFQNVSDSVHQCNSWFDYESFWSYSIQRFSISSVPVDCVHFDSHLKALAQKWTSKRKLYSWGLYVEFTSR